MGRPMNKLKATFDKDRNRWKKRLPTGSSAQSKWAYGKTEAECLGNWRELLGLNAVRLRPGSVGQFVEKAKFWEWMSGRVSAMTLERYKILWNHQIGPAFGTTRFDEITPSVAQEKLLTCGNSPSVRENAKSLLGQITKLAIASNDADASVQVAISLAKVGQRTPKQRFDVLSRCGAVLDQSKGTYLEGPLWIMYTLGLRWGEVCGLKRSDLKGDVLTIQRQRNDKVGELPYVKKRKAGERRTIGLPRELRSQIEQFAGSGIYFFEGPGGQPLDYSHAYRKLAPFQSKEEGVEKVTMHDFRSAAIVNLYGRVDEKTYYNLFGHKAIEQTRDYLDESAVQTREALQILVNI